MNDLEMEMQFADPDWQPASSRPGPSSREQALAAPVEIKNTADPHQQAGQTSSVDIRDRDKAGAYEDYSQGYQSASSSDQHQKQAAMPIWTPGSGQTPSWPIPSTGAEASSGTGQNQQQPAPVQLKSRQQRELLGLLARVALVVVWLTTPLVTRAFHGGWILPLLGVFFLPVTALTYTVVFALAGSVTGLGWLWIVGALLLDLASHTGQTSKRKSSPPQDVK